MDLECYCRRELGEGILEKEILKSFILIS